MRTGGDKGADESPNTTEELVGHLRPHPERIVYDVIDGQVLIIRSDTGSYYSLEGPAADVWRGLRAGLDDAELMAAIESRYVPDSGNLATDVDAFLTSLLSEGLVEEGQIATVTEFAAAVTSAAAWVAPRLQSFTDMQDLLLFDPIHEVGPEGWPHAADG